MTQTDENLNLSIGGYLIRRLQDYGIADVSAFRATTSVVLHDAGAKPAHTVGCTREDCAGFAADAYARVHGMGGVVCYLLCRRTERVQLDRRGLRRKSPVVMITGSPGFRERIRNPLLHHMVRDLRTQYDVFERLCCAGTELSDPLQAFSEIDRVLATCARTSGLYTRDSSRHGPRPAGDFAAVQASGTAQRYAGIDEAVDETVERIKNARQPVLLLGVEIHRFGLQEEAVRWPRGRAFPWPPRCWAKAWWPRRTRSIWGCTKGALGRDEVTKFVEASDCVLMLGTFMTDINLGIYTAELDLGDCIS